MSFRARCAYILPTTPSIPTDPTLQQQLGTRDSLAPSSYDRSHSVVTPVLSTFHPRFHYAVAPKVHLKTPLRTEICSKHIPLAHLSVATTGLDAFSTIDTALYLP
jgi:hypothetical protein